MKIYTRTGDEGMTGLSGGQRVSKDSPRVEAYGNVDELNAMLGCARAETPHEPLKNAIAEIQATLFTVGAILASPKQDPKIEVITSKHVDSLERQMDVVTETLPPMRYFILPGGGKTAARLHVARTVCRRAERSVVGLSRLPNENIDQWLLIYMNRLSDLLFILARLANQLENIADIEWKGRG